LKDAGGERSQIIEGRFGIGIEDLVVVQFLQPFLFVRREHGLWAVSNPGTYRDALVGIEDLEPQGNLCGAACFSWQG
jgi:hypothetical protein